MSKSTSAIESATTATKLLSDICDIPALSPLKPLINIAHTICEHAAAVNENKEAIIALAKRVNSTVHILINRARDFKGPMPENYMDDLRKFEDVLENISTALQKICHSRNRWYRRLLPRTTASQIRDLNSELDNAFQLFGLSADIEARQTNQTVRSIVPGELSSLTSSKPDDPAIILRALQTDRVLHTTDEYSVQTGSYRNQAVVVLKYFKPEPEGESIFAQDMSQRQDQTHPFILRVFISCEKARIMLLLAEDLIFCEQDMDNFENIRRPWQEQTIGEAISSTDLGTLGTPSGRPFPRTFSRDSQVSLGSLPFLTIKESAALLKQFIEVVTFLRRNKVKVAWWQFQPSWVGLRPGTKKMLLIDWTEAIQPKPEVKFDPGYAIHLMGLGFSPKIPDLFQDSIRKGLNFSTLLTPASRSPKVETLGHCIALKAASSHLKMSTNSWQQSRMLLNTIEQADFATFDFKAEPTLTANRPTWVARAIVTGVSPVLSRSIYVGTHFDGLGPSKTAAKEAACQQMLEFFASFGVYPTYR